MSKEGEVFDLPENIVVEIMCWLPVKSLIRFSCVSKRWRSIIIFDPQFAKSHLQLANEQRTLRHRVLVSTLSMVYGTSICSPTLLRNSRLQCSEDLSGDNIHVTHCTFPCEHQSTIVMASCNGLVVLGKYYVDLSIWNPPTGFFRKIPDPKFSSLTNGSCKRLCGKFGFGFVSSTDDYKLVLVIPDKYSDVVVYVNVDVNIFIFSMRANSWSSRKASHWSFSNFRWMIEHCRVFSNEAIHWINSSGYDVDGSLIEACYSYAFDLASEELRQMPVPGFDQDDEENYHFVGKWMQMVVYLGGCLCLLSHSSQLYEEIDDIGLWMMRDYGVSDSWIEVFKFSEDDINISLVHGLYASAGDDTICVSLQKVMPLSSNSLKKKLVKIECRKGEKPVCSSAYMLEEHCRVCSRGEFLLDTIVYDETLVSIPL